MNLMHQLNQEWDRLVAKLGAGHGRAALVLDVDGGRLECDVVGIDQLACAFERLTFQDPRLQQAKLERLKQIAADLSRRLSYLLESISPVETDLEGCVVQLRSNPPQKDDDGTSYYELVARRGEISLSRYTKTGGQARRMIPAHVTREVFHRLARDLSSSA